MLVGGNGVVCSPGSHLAPPPPPRHGACSSGRCGCCGVAGHSCSGRKTLNFFFPSDGHTVLRFACYFVAEPAAPALLAGTVAPACGRTTHGGTHAHTHTAAHAAHAHTQAVLTGVLDACYDVLASAELWREGGRHARACALALACTRIFIFSKQHTSTQCWPSKRCRQGVALLLLRWVAGLAVLCASTPPPVHATPPASRA